MEDYIKDPHKIEERSFEMIREATDLSGFTDIQQQVVKLTNQMRFVLVSQVGKIKLFGKEVLCGPKSAERSGKFTPYYPQK